MDDSKHQHKFSDFFYNKTTYFGVFLALTIFLIELILFGLDYFSSGHNIYLGIITYTILPPFLIIGLILIPVGALRRRSRILKGAHSARQLPIYINFSNPKHRNACFVFIVGTTIFVAMSIIGSYQAYHYTESVHFCGITCHDVMEPQYTRYQQSSHARIQCVECHVGSGADSYFNAKLNGVKQIYSLATKKYPKPITGPVKNLRPATETCLHCHWPGKTLGVVERTHQYFITDSDGPKTWFLRMIMKVGHKNRGSTGIHAHMYVDNDIYYAADDEKRQQISWVKAVDKKGQATVFVTPDSPWADKEPPADKIRKMDCIDCHNRPTHKFMDPVSIINEAIADGTLDAGLPAIKEVVSELLSGEYADTDEAARKIHDGFVSHYQEALGESYGLWKRSVEVCANYLVSVYKGNFFPKMKARWDQYPDNIGHLISPGCFRCHGGDHVSKSGKVISRDCTTCHTIIEQGPVGQVERNMDGIMFRHPVDIGGAWESLNCYECHTGN